MTEELDYVMSAAAGKVFFLLKHYTFSEHIFSPLPVVQSHIFVTFI